MDSNCWVLYAEKGKGEKKDSHYRKMVKTPIDKTIRLLLLPERERERERERESH